MRRFRSIQPTVQERTDWILAFLRDKGGEASMKELCIGLGYSWPSELESARGILIAMAGRGLIVKSVRPNHQTRIAYYSLADHPAPAAQGE